MCKWEDFSMRPSRLLEMTNGAAISQSLPCVKGGGCEAAGGIEKARHDDLSESVINHPPHTSFLQCNGKRPGRIFPTRLESPI